MRFNCCPKCYRSGGKSNFEPVPKPPEKKRRSNITSIPNFDQGSIGGEIQKFPKTPEDDKLIRDAIRRNDFLDKILKGSLLDQVVEAMYHQKVEAKSVIIKEGDAGNQMYVAVAGKYEVIVKDKGLVNVFEDVRVFGELAILYTAKRNATVRAAKPGHVWVLDRAVYKKLTIGINVKEQEETLEFLQQVPILQNAGPEILNRVALLLKVKFYQPGTTILKEGEKGSSFYIIRAGTVSITKHGEGVVANLDKGKFFGERALLEDEMRQATVTAGATSVECLTLEREEFIAHFGELEALAAPAPNPELHRAISPQYQDLELKDLKIHSTLGIGGFGKVELALASKQSFALKLLKKIDIVEQNQQEHVFNEKNIQMACRSMFLVQLHRTFKDSRFLYLLMEPCMGGDLHTLLHRQKYKRFEEGSVQFIAACVIGAFSYLHERSIIYRDLKPENLMIHASGVIKLTDFGFAKILSEKGRSYTFVGTPEYVAPEIILSRGHDRGVDYWTLGILIFEMLTGRTPFKTNDPSHMRTYNLILTGITHVSFPALVSRKARNLIEKLCKTLSADRIGCQKNGIRDIKKSKWFETFNWVHFNDGSMDSPFKPKLDSETDTSHFEIFQRSRQDSQLPSEESSGFDVDF